MGDAPDPAGYPFRAFIGIAPRLYQQVFAMPERKTDDGQWLDWERMRHTSWPRWGAPANVYVLKERQSVLKLRQDTSDSDDDPDLTESR